jgi:hypothetical protein
MDEERSIISICGSNLVDVHAAVEDVDIFIKKIAVEDIELDHSNNKDLFAIYVNSKITTIYKLLQQ